MTASTTTTRNARAIRAFGEALGFAPISAAR
jgi:hypothetical protein